jgi:hypothetical protein
LKLLATKLEDLTFLRLDGSSQAKLALGIHRKGSLSFHAVLFFASALIKQINLVALSTILGEVRDLTSGWGA